VCVREKPRATSRSFICYSNRAKQQQRQQSKQGDLRKVRLKPARRTFGSYLFWIPCIFFLLLTGLLVCFGLLFCPVATRKTSSNPCPGSHLLLWMCLNASWVANKTTPHPRTSAMCENRNAHVDRRIRISQERVNGKQGVFLDDAAKRLLERVIQGEKRLLMKYRFLFWVWSAAGGIIISHTSFPCSPFFCGECVVFCWSTSVFRHFT
jgi:hypothetical protein